MEELKLYCEKRTYENREYNNYYVVDKKTGIKVPLTIKDNVGKQLIDSYYQDNNLVK